MRLLPGLLALFACTALAADPLRVVSLAPSMTEIMLELRADDLLVGVLDGGERPAALRDLPSVGRQGQLNMERLLSLRPELLLLWPGSVPPAQRDQLKRLGIATFSAEPHDIDQLIAQIEAIAERIGRAEQGHQYAKALRERLQQLREQYRRDEPLQVFYQVWDQPLYTLGGRQVVSDALAVCGARNVFADLNQPAPQVRCGVGAAAQPTGHPGWRSSATGELEGLAAIACGCRWPLAGGARQRSGAAQRADDRSHRTLVRVARG